MCCNGTHVLSFKSSGQEFNPMDVKVLDANVRVGGHITS